jgi:hypothetical protein
MEPMNCPVVERFALSELTFPEADVLTTPEEKSARRADLHRATQLGNLSRTKVRVEFWDALGCKVLHTTVWASTAQVVVFKEGMTLPVHRVARISFPDHHHSSVV